MRQRPALARYAARDLRSTAHTTEIAGTTRGCRIGIPEMEEKALMDLSPTPSPVRQTMKAVEVSGTETVGRALEIQEVHLLGDEMPCRRS